MRRALLAGLACAAFALPAAASVHKGARGPGHVSRIQSAPAAAPPAAQFFFPTGTDLILAAATL